jgi:hypothetical protein
MNSAEAGTGGRAIVTASDSGIGKASAVVLAAAGFDIGVTWHEDEEGALGTAREVEGLGRRAVVRRLDLTQPESGAAVIEELADELGGLDVLVNNAGTGGTTPFLEMTLDEWHHTLNVDLTGAFVCAQAAARRMADGGRGGRIINITSVHEHIPKTGSSAYCAAKAGLGLLTKVMALELGPQGITVNAIAPGQIATPMTGMPDVDPTTERRPNIPLGRPGSAHEIASAVAFLASPGGAYTTGASFVIDGGLMQVAADHGNEEG